MKPCRLVFLAARIGFLVFAAAAMAQANWPTPLVPPMHGIAAAGGYEANYAGYGMGGYGVPQPANAMGGYAGMPGSTAVYGGTPTMPTANVGAIPYGCGPYGDYSGGNCFGSPYPQSSGQTGYGQLGGLASGCRPIGLLGRLGAITGLGGCGLACGVNGYHPGAYHGSACHGGRSIVNPYDSYPGAGSQGEFVNMGDVCCGPHWYDIMVQGVFLRRERDTNVGLTSEGPRGFGEPNLVLSTSDLSTDLNSGIRVAGRLQLNAVNSLEGVWTGGIGWSDTQTVFSNFNDLYSVYSDFGIDPLGGFEDTDQAARHSASLDSDLDSIEINYRHDWVRHNYRSSGSFILGGRYIRLRDRFQFATEVVQHLDEITDPNNPVLFGPGASLYDVTTGNDMVGMHAGADLVQCIVPGFMIGAQGKFGIYGNGADQATTFQATTGLLEFNESARATVFSWSSDAQVYFLWQIHPLAKIRGGYELLFLDRVATGFDNFNPNDVFQPRNAVLNDDGRLLIHGFQAGIEFGW